MVTALKIPSRSRPTVSQPRFLELVGPAGCGKSTLARALCQHSDEFTIGTEIAFRDVEQIPLLLKSIPLILSSLALRVQHSRPWTWEEIKFLIYVKKWHTVLERQAKSHRGMILLDHGPVFKLATLHAFGPGWLRSASADIWWRDLFQGWAALLDLIVWLDAPDPLLEIRINARNQKHRIKGKTRPEVIQFLGSYRSAYRFVLAGLAASAGTHVIQFDTSQSTKEQITEEILAVCNREVTGF